MTVQSHRRQADLFQIRDATSKEGRCRVSYGPTIDSLTATCTVQHHLFTNVSSRVAGL